MPINSFLTNHRVVKSFLLIIGSAYYGFIVWILLLSIQSNYFQIHKEQLLKSEIYETMFLRWFLANFLIGNFVTGLLATRWEHNSNILEGWHSLISGWVFGIFSAVPLLYLLFLQSSNKFIILIGLGIVVVTGGIGFVSQYISRLFIKLNNIIKAKLPFLARWGNYINSHFLLGDFPEMQDLFWAIMGSAVLFNALGLIIGKFSNNSILANLVKFCLIIISTALIVAWWESPKMKQAKAKREEEQKIKDWGLMATFTAHQMNQPLGIMRVEVTGALYNLKTDYFQPEDIKPLLEHILAQIDRLAKIVKKADQFVQTGTDHYEDINLNSLIEQVAAKVAEQFKFNNIILHLNLCPVPPIVLADQYLLEEVLHNLLSNAKDALAGQANAVVEIETWQRNGNGKRGFTVTDNGLGVALEYQDQLFMPFSSTKSTSKSSGLGLYTSKRIVTEKLDGEIRYENCPERGAKFIVEFPPPNIKIKDK